MKDRLSNALKAAMKGGDKRRVETIRLINAAVKDREIEARSSGGVVDEAAILALLQKMIKSRQESEGIYVKAGRTDLATREREEIAVIEDFLPSQMSDGEMAEAVGAAIAATGAASIKDMGKVVSVLKSQYAGRMDFARASAVVKSRLTGA